MSASRWLGCVVSAICMATMLPAYAAAQNQPASAVEQLQQTLQRASQNLEASLVAIVGVGSAGPMVLGTGFFVANDGSFVTASHVFQANRGVQFQAYVTGEDGEKHLFPFTTLRADDRHDLRLCRIQSYHEPSKPRIRALPLARNSTAIPGTLIVSSGFPLTSPNAVLHFGPVAASSSPDQTLELAVMVNEGESGAPVLRLDTEEVIGMIVLVRTASVYSQNSGAEQNSGLTLAARVEWLQALLNEAATTTPAPGQPPHPLGESR